MIPIFGTASIAGGGGYSINCVTEKDSLKILEVARDKGITTFDTAPIYGFGEAENRLAQFLKNKDELKVISKSGVGWHPHTFRVDMDNDPIKTKIMLENSLRTLNRPIDHYLVHYPDKKWDIRYPLEVIMKYRDKGEVLNVGLSNPQVSDIQKAREITPLSMIQAELNFYSYSHWTEILSHTQQEELVCWGVFDKGLLFNTTKVDKKYEEKDGRHKAIWRKKKIIEEKLKQINLLYKNLGHPNNWQEVITKLSLKNIVETHPKITPIIGYSSTNQLDHYFQSQRSAPITSEMLEIARKTLCLV